MVGLVGGTQPSLPPAGDPVPESLRQLRAHAAAALRQAAPPDPAGSIDLPYAQIAVRSIPAGATAGLGGDWHETVRLPDGRLFLAVGDVSGHGPAAIDEMTRLRHAMLGLSMTGDRCGPLLARLNALVLHRFEGTTATVVCGHYDPATRRLSWAQAGHPAPILVRRGAGHQLPSPLGVVLGATAHPPYGMAEVQLEPGDLLLMFTDGLVERRTRDIGDGVSVAIQAAEQVLTCDVHDLGPCVDLDVRLDRLIEVTGGPNPEDDMCLLAVRMTG